MLEPLSRRSILAGASAVALAGPVPVVADPARQFEEAVALAESEGLAVLLRRTLAALPPAPAGMLNVAARLGWPASGGMSRFLVGLNLIPDGRWIAGPVPAERVPEIQRRVTAADGVVLVQDLSAIEPHPDAELLRLCLDWLDSWAESDRLNLEARTLADRLGLRGGINHPDFCALDDLAEAEGRRGGELLDRLCPIAALTLEGLFAKAVIGMRDEWLTDPSASSRLSSNILRDLHSLIAPGAGQQVQRILNHPVTVAALAEVFGEDAPMAGTACGRCAA